MRKFARRMKRMSAEDKLILGLGVVMVVGLLILGIIRFTGNTAQILTIDDLHEQNLKGKLKEDQGYLYEGFSFVNFSGVWYSQIVAPKGSIYDVAFNHDPRSVEDIPVKGSLNADFLKRGTFYITFDPLDENLQYVGKANAGLSTALTKAFGKYLVAGCLVNETDACHNVPIITCDDENKSVIVLLNEAPAQVTLDNNCVIIQGADDDLVRAKDRLLLRWYGIKE
ncbi:hypothetical protein D6774_02670 [Candidatus Woesearchaeota archaeon]|nr:MAG: hypothetical protein D6774_02670 [Candidatus Woesearchaeota archaeon]